MANQSDVERKEKETEQYRTFEIWNVKKKKKTTSNINPTCIVIRCKLQIRSKWDIVSVLEHKRSFDVFKNADVKDILDVFEQ